ncbi:MAG: 2-amino-4-hydroxy-6-hydroxymethyldihydropteridine diphosphokinase [Acidimicrobiales bacterium]|nr:MAG: 2-amino-4-hydroxy-6-hydroxymethyldihydropteridine diphosphokinase [Acidimicrobiales bacterium]
MRAFLGLGSNLGDRRRQLREAVSALPDLVAVSPLYQSDPVGGPPGQGQYLNLVAELDTDLTARQLLSLCHWLEGAAGRVRGERWGSRSLDVDVLLVGELETREDDLVVPHPLMWNRGFVLRPLADLAPELVPPGWEAWVVGRAEPAGTLDLLANGTPDAGAGTSKAR